MRLEAVVHEAENGGFWAEVPAIPGCATQGDNLLELLANLYEAAEGCLAVDDALDAVRLAPGSIVLLY